MADLALGTVVDSPRFSSDAQIILVSGAGADATTVIAASTTGYQHVVTRMHVTWNGGADESVVIKSGSTTLHTLYFGAEQMSFSIPPGLIYTAADEALIFDKSAATGVISAIVEYVTVLPGDYIGIL
jgi:hypothetical protein